MNPVGVTANLEIDHSWWNNVQSGKAGKVTINPALQPKRKKALKTLFPKATMPKVNPGVPKPIVNVIRKVGGQHCVYSEGGKSLGGCGSLAKAKKRLQQVEYFKHVNNQKLSPMVSVLLDIINNWSPTTKKRFKQVAGFGTGAAGGFGGAAAGAAGGAALGSVVPGVGTAIGGLVGGAIGAGAGTWGANKVAKRFGGKTAESASDWGGLAGSMVSPGALRGVAKGGAKLLGMGAAKGAAGGVAKSTTGAAVRTGLKAPTGMQRIGRAIKAGRYGMASRMAGVGAAKGTAKLGASIGAYQGTQSALDSQFPGKQRKPRIPKATMNAWTAEARRRSIEKRRSHTQPEGMSTAAKVGVTAGALTGGLGYKLVEPDIDKGVNVIRTAIRDRGIRSLKAIGKLLARIRK